MHGLSYVSRLLLQAAGVRRGRGVSGRIGLLPTSCRPGTKSTITGGGGTQASIPPPPPMATALGLVVCTSNFTALAMNRAVFSGFCSSLE